MPPYLRLRRFPLLGGYRLGFRPSFPLGRWNPAGEGHKGPSLVEACFVPARRSRFL